MAEADFWVGQDRKQGSGSAQGMDARSLSFLGSGVKARGTVKLDSDIPEVRRFWLHSKRQTDLKI